MDLSLLAQSNQIMEQAGAFFQTLKPDTLADILLYLVFFVALLTTFMLADGNNMAGNLFYGTMVLAIFNITVGNEWYIMRGSNEATALAFAAFAARVCMFLLPFVAAGATRVKKNKGKAAMPLGIVAGIIGLLYAAGSFLLPSIMNSTLF